MCSLLHRTAFTGMQTRRLLGTLRWRSGAQRPPRLSSAAPWWSATSRWTTSSQLNASTDCSVSVFVSVGLFVLTSPTLFSEERESSGETVPIPEVVQRRAAGETSGCDGHDQGDQTQRTTQEHGRGGPLQVRQSHSKMSSQIKDRLIWPYPDQFSKKKSLSPKKRNLVSPQEPKLVLHYQKLRSLLVIKSHFYNLLTNHEFKMYICI